jgi:16S rRNA (guanine966-N2)-methyltransferase
MRQTWDIAFIDPPFGNNLVDPVCTQLAAGGMVAEGGFIYVETGARDPEPAVPGDWRLHRQKAAGDVIYRLFIRCA